MEKEVKLNKEEIEILNNIEGKAYWLVRDKCGSLYVHNEYPKKNRENGHWKSEWMRLDIMDDCDHLFKFVKWSDSKPHDIDELMKIAEINKVLKEKKRIEEIERVREIERNMKLAKLKEEKRVAIKTGLDILRRMVANDYGFTQEQYEIIENMLLKEGAIYE